MKTVVITDGRYRSSLAAIRSLGEAGWRVIVTQTEGEAVRPPASFSSRYIAESRWIAGSCKEEAYKDRLVALLQTLDHPVLFCTGADTLNLVSRYEATFRPVADFLIAPPEALDALNDKEAVHHRAIELGVPVPKEYPGIPEAWPVVIKPHCGEKFGLKARDRYVIAENEGQFQEKYGAMARYDPNPLVQEQVFGPGEGVNLLLGQEGELLCALCHRRLREYPVTGGPSTCCVSFYDAEMIQNAYRLLSSFGFIGMAMVEFKAGRVLEVNPRVWGSFPLTACCQSPYAVLYARAAAGEKVAYTPQDYKTGVKMRFLFNDIAATLGYLKHRQIGKALGGMADFFRVPEALNRRDDRKAYWAYLRSSLRDR